MLGFESVVSANLCILSCVIKNVKRRLFKVLARESGFFAFKVRPDFGEGAFQVAQLLFKRGGVLLSYRLFDGAAKGLDANGADVPSTGVA